MGAGMYPATVQCNGWLDPAQSPTYIPPLQDWCCVSNIRNNIVSRVLSYSWGSLRTIQVCRDLSPFLIGKVPTHEDRRTGLVEGRCSIKQITWVHGDFPQQQSSSVEIPLSFLHGCNPFAQRTEMWWAAKALHNSQGALQSQPEGLRRDTTVIRQKEEWPKGRVTKGVGHNDPTTTFIQSFWNAIFEGIRLYFDWIKAVAAGFFATAPESMVWAEASCCKIVGLEAVLTVWQKTPPKIWHNVHPNRDFILWVIFKDK